MVYTSSLFLLTNKPTIYIANVGEKDIEKNDTDSMLIKEFSQQCNSEYLRLCGNIEMEISNLTKNEQTDYLLMYNLKLSGLDKLIKLAYSMLGLETFFTAGEKEIKAWTIQKGVTAPQAAGVVHADFQRGFIKAEIYTVNDLEKYKSELSLKNSGKIRQEGKDYVVQDGDIIFFKFNI